MRRRVVELVDVYSGYNGRAVVSGASLRIYEGERVVVMGPNGSGKSTLLKTVPRLVEIYRGRVLFMDTDVTSLRARDLPLVRSRIGYLPQGSVLFPHMRAIDNVALPLRLVKKMRKREAYARALEVMREMGVAVLAERYPAQLSGGQAQRVAIARALAMDPELLLLDEPTASLDPEGRREVLETLHEVARTGRSMVVVTHEIEFARRAADRIVFMERGRIVSEKTPGEL